LLDKAKDAMEKLRGTWNEFVAAVTSHAFLDASIKAAQLLVIIALLLAILAALSTLAAAAAV
jgi:hypothetical protein